MALPYPSKTFTAGQVPTTDQWNELNANDQALAAGTGLNSVPSNVLANPYKFSAYRNAAYTTAVATVTKLPFDAENFDTGNNFDSTTNFRFTAPIAGFYQFDASMLFGVSQSRVFMPFYKNGAEYRRGTDNTAGSLGVQNSLFIQLAASDYIEVFYFTTGATAMTTGSVTQFNGYLVSKT